MNLQITRPIIFLDIESTGLNREADRIIELAFLKLDVDGTTTNACRRFNPGIPIPEASTAIHGIKNEDVENLAMFKEFASQTHRFLLECDIAGYGSNYFDIPLLYFELLRAGINWDYTKNNFIDVGNLFKIQEPRDLTAAVKFYTGKEHSDAHGALPDVLATVEVFKAQIERYELPQNVNELAIYSNYGNKILDLSGKLTYNPEGVIIFNFGPKRGEPALDNIDFVEWMMMKDFAPDTQAICQQLINEFYKY
jgi:DNA polymerase III subunit epsilon